MNYLLNTTKYIVFILTLVLLGCNGHESSDSADTHKSEEEHAQETLSVKLTEQQIDAVNIEVGQLSRLPLKNSIKVNGILELPPQNKGDVSSLVSGAIQTVNVIEGDYVTKGQVLARLEDPQIIELQQDYVDASERLAYLEQEYERKKRLLDEEVGSQSEFQQIASDYHSTRSKAQGLKSKLELLGLDPKEAREGNIKASAPIRAPLEGYVQVIEVNTGSYVTPGQKLFEIVNNHHIHIDLMVYEKDLHKVRKNQTVYFRYTSQSEEKFYEARIFAVGKTFEQESKAVRVHAELTNQQLNLFPGMYVEGRIVTDSTEVLALPEEAVVSDGGTSYIFVGEQQDEHITVEQVSESGNHDHGTRFRAIEVMTGTKDDGYVEIKLLADLEEDAKVVTKGAFFILSEMKKGEGGHHH